MPTLSKAKYEFNMESNRVIGYNKGFLDGKQKGRDLAAQEGSAEILKAKAECLSAMAKGLYAMAITMNGTGNWK
jgi:hypothetical protein